MSSLISSNYPDTSGCPRLGNIATFPEQQGKGPTGKRQLDPTNVMEGPAAANDIMEGSIMLVLSRKVGESILISESIRVTVVQSTNNGRIRLGIEAPPEVIVLREELTKFCSNSSPSQNGKAEARPPSA
jgi:carbon storage regulator